MILSPEDATTGRENYYDAVGFSRREFLMSTLASGAVASGGLGALYFGYSQVNNPLRVGIIGVGDEGNVLIGGLNPKYVQCVAIADIRPFGIHRAFHGDWASDTALEARPGLMAKYGWKSEDEARRNVKVYEGDYHELLDNPDIEAVIIALPLHLHAEAAVHAMLKGKHVLTEKLMAHNIAQCKAMCRVAKEQGKYLAVGHQRHYSILYDNAVHLIKSGVFGELHHIRAQWHRGNLPGNDSWQQPLPGGETNREGKKLDKIVGQLNRMKADLAKETDQIANEKLAKKVAQWEAWARDAKVEAVKHGYADFKLGDRSISALEELCRWRLWERTGGGLMAELGSHQLDASTIFCSALRKDGKKAHPLSVHALGGRYTFGNDRQAEDHVYCMFEFPGPGYEPDFNVGYKDDVLAIPDPAKGIPSYDVDPNKKIIVTYSSINGNGYGGYGEIVMGTKGTLILEREKDVMIYKDADTATRVGMSKNEKGAAVLDTQASGKTAAVAKASEGPVSRGYQEEIEHWAWCIRNPAPENQPRCKGEIAMGDAVIALATNVAIKNANSGKGGYLKFDEAWYDADKPETPDGSSVEDEYKKLTKV